MEPALHDQLSRLSSPEVVDVFKLRHVPKWLRFVQRTWNVSFAARLENSAKRQLFEHIVDFCAKAFPLEDERYTLTLRPLLAIAAGAAERRYLVSAKEPENALEYDMAFFEEYAKRGGAAPTWFE